MPLPDPWPVHISDARPTVHVTVPGSKSVSCRALVLAAFAKGTSHLCGLLRGDDTDALSAALATLKQPIQLGDAEAIVEGGGRLQGGGATLDLGHGGTPARFMLAVASVADGDTIIDGSDRLRERPMGDMVELLRMLGITVEELGESGRLPLRVRGGEWTSRVLEVGETASSQFLSALLLVAASTPAGLELRLRRPPTSAAYLALTIAELRRWGVEVRTSYGDGWAATIEVVPGAMVAQRRAIPADASSALFWASAAAILPGSTVHLPGLSLDDGQPDAAAIPVLAEMGLQVETNSGGLILRGPESLRGVGQIDCHTMPDAAPAIAVACCYADDTTRMTGLHTLRVKESDRIATIASELAAAGADIKVVGDDLIIHPAPLPSTAVTIKTWDDHRIAMAGAVLGLRRGGLSITEPACTAKSYPAFWTDLERFAVDGRIRDTAKQ
jgi:3-phosphoshikimate 1-carboxyvinyltransferase